MDSGIVYNKAHQIEINIKQIRIDSHIRKLNESSSIIKQIYLVICLIICVEFLVGLYYDILWLQTL